MYKIFDYKITEVVLQSLFLFRGVGVTPCVQKPTIAVFEIDIGRLKKHFFWYAQCTGYGYRSTRSLSLQVSPIIRGQKTIGQALVLVVS